MSDVVTGSLFHSIEERLAPQTLLRSLAHLIFTGLNLAINRIGFVLEAVDRRFVHGPLRPAMNLLPSTRCPVERGS